MNYYEQLEKEYAKFVGTKYAVAVSSGTAALHLSLVSLGIGVGDEVIVPDFTMAACGFAVSYTGAKVVTVDCGNDLNIDVTKIEEKITEKTKAIMGVHIYGRLCDMKAIRRIADANGIFVIEDACEAQGAAKGGWSDCLVFSFYKNKIIHAEEGGIVCIDSEVIYNNIKDLKNMAFGSEHNYFHERIGFNYRMTESQAKLALESLGSYEQNKMLRRMFEKTMEKKAPSKMPKRDAVWVYDFLCRDEAERDATMQGMKVLDYQPRYFFKPLSTMPMWKQETGPNALRYSQIGMYLPFDVSMIDTV